MNKDKVITKWTGGMSFDSTVPPGITFKMDAAVSSGGGGNDIRPKALMLSSLAGCTAMDIAMLLKKMRAEVKNFEIEVEAKLTDEHPKYYKEVHIIYKFYSSKFKENKIEKAVLLSVEQYCGVMEMFRQFSTVTHEILYFKEEL